MKTAALLHDIGKLAVPEHILSKPGPLTQEEFQKIRIHPQVGAEIISAVPFPYPVAPLILSHHERWDGKGYPQGLKGDEIPLGARILSVVDYFDALTSDRPYHRAMDHEAALSVLEQESGKALDPQVVKIFFEQLPLLAAEADRLEHAPARRLTLEPTSELRPPRRGLRERNRQGQHGVRGHRARAPGNLRALRDRPVDGHEPGRRRHDGAHQLEAEQPRAVFRVRAVPLRRGAGHAALPLRHRRRCRTDRRHDHQSGQGLTGWVARNRRPLVNARPSAEFEAAGLPPASTSLQSALISPLIFNDRLIGTLAVYQETEEAYTDDHRRLLDRVCEQASAVIYNAIVFERPRKTRSPTRSPALPNTRFMFMHLTRELARAERLKSEVSLLVMDCDNFKEINDTHGHHVGDRALREVANVLRAGIRPYDICVRYAGDEFIVVLSGCGADEAERKRRRTQAGHGRRGLRAAARTPPARLSISVGAAVYPHDGETYEALLASADGRMYRDKTQSKHVARSSPGRLGARGRSGIRLPPLPSDITDGDIERARTGVL